MCRAIAECAEVDEVKDIRDKAMAMEAYAKQAMNTEAERQAINIRLRAERKAGEMLKEMEREPGKKEDNYCSGHAEPSTLTPLQEAKEQAGISDTQAKRWQQLAKVPMEDFENALNDPKVKPSTSGIIKKVPETDHGPKGQFAMYLWGRCRDIERHNITDYKPNEIYHLMTDGMKDDMRRLIPLIADFLNQMENDQHEC